MRKNDDSNRDDIAKDSRKKDDRMPGPGLLEQSVSRY
jgi:hypothetical protein